MKRIHISQFAFELALMFFHLTKRKHPRRKYAEPYRRDGLGNETDHQEYISSWPPFPGRQHPHSRQHDERRRLGNVAARLVRRRHRGRPRNVSVVACVSVLAWAIWIAERAWLVSHDLLHFLTANTPSAAIMASDGGSGTSLTGSA